MEIEIQSAVPLTFSDGSPVRAASAIARLGEGWLIAQDDATHAAWLRGSTATPLRLLPPIEGHDVFEESADTKRLKPDLEAACEVTVDGGAGVLLLGSGSNPARTRAALVTNQADGPRAVDFDLARLYPRVADALGFEAKEVNLEGACPVHDSLRWFNRGVPAAGVPAGSVDLDLAALLAAISSAGSLDAVALSNPCQYDLGDVRGVGLAITDAVALPADRILASAAAEDTSNSSDDGAVVGSSLALLAGSDVLEVTALPQLDGRVVKVEGLAVTAVTAEGVSLIAVVDADQADTPSLLLHAQVSW